MTANPHAPIPAELRQQVIAEMRRVFGPDQRRIDHALGVLEAAEAILAHMQADPLVVVPVAVLHDIGITAAEAKHGSSDARYQELEGPPIARGILEKLGLDKARVDHICDIIANHHCARGRITPEFRILWDADMIINMMPDKPLPPDTLSKILSHNFRTDPGRQLARERFEAVR